MTQPTIGDMVAKYRELKDYVEAEDAAHAERLKPYKDGLDALLTACGVVLTAQMGSDGKANFSCDEGTAYLQHGLSVKVDNRAAFLKFITEQDQWEFLDAGVLKDPVRAWLDKTGEAPPGIVVQPFVKTIIRK